MGKLFHDVCQNSHKDAINKLALYCEDLAERVELLEKKIEELEKIVSADGQEVENESL